MSDGWNHPTISSFNLQIKTLRLQNYFGNSLVYRFLRELEHFGIHFPQEKHCYDLDMLSNTDNQFLWEGRMAHSEVHRDGFNPVILSIWERERRFTQDKAPTESIHSRDTSSYTYIYTQSKLTYNVHILGNVMIVWAKETFFTMCIFYYDIKLMFGKTSK